MPQCWTLPAKLLSIILARRTLRHRPPQSSPRGPAGDLVLLQGRTSFTTSIGRIRRSSSVGIDETVRIHGHSDLPDQPDVPRPRFFHASGTWRGVILREDGTTVAAISSREVLKGMSGAPVCDRSGRVVGVVSGRYNSMDGWAEGTVWPTGTPPNPSSPPANSPASSPRTAHRPTTGHARRPPPTSTAASPITSAPTSRRQSPPHRTPPGSATPQGPTSTPPRSPATRRN